MVQANIVMLKEMEDDPRLLNQEDPAFWEVMNPFRKVCGLPSLPLEKKYDMDFSGKWI